MGVHYMFLYKKEKHKVHTLLYIIIYLTALSKSFQAG